MQISVLGCFQQQQILTRQTSLAAVHDVGDPYSMWQPQMPCSNPLPKNISRELVLPHHITFLTRYQEHTGTRLLAYSLLQIHEAHILIFISYQVCYSDIHTTQKYLR